MTRWRAPRKWRAKRRWRRSHQVSFSSLHIGRHSPRSSTPSRLRKNAPKSVTRLQAYTGERQGDRSAESGRNKGRIRLTLRFSVTAVVILGLFLTLVVRLWNLQVVDGPALFSLAKGITTRTIAEPAPRGLICARGGCVTSSTPCTTIDQVLASNATYNVATLTRTELQNDPSVVTRLAQILGVSSASLQAIVKNESLQYSPAAPLPIAGIPPELPSVTPEVIAEVSQHESEFPGVSFSQTTERCYPHDEIAAQAIGYVGAITASISGLSTSEQQKATAQYEKEGYAMTDSQFGLSGLESQYEKYLRGTAGKETVAVDPFSNPVGQPLSEKGAVPGDNVVLNLDLGLQEKASTALTNEMAALHAGANKGAGTGADWGGLVVEDVQTGGILAMDSYPNYDANVWVPVISQSNYSKLLNGYGEPLNNYAISGLQAPGSTFKIATATAALKAGLISPFTYIDDTGVYKIGNPPTILHDSDNEALGEVNVSSALAKSSDVFFYTLGGWFATDTQKYGVTPIQNTAHAYGIGVKSKIDLPGASSGQVDSQRLRETQHAENPSAFPNTTYYEGDNVEMAFGQGETLSTPLEIAGAYATFANHGTRLAPEMAAGITSPSGKLVKAIAPKVVTHVKMPDSAGYNAMLQGFEDAVQTSTGTAYADFTGFNLTKWNIAGKTGTATSSAADAISPTAWFVAFGGPRGQAPKYVVAVEIDRAGFGADAAAPVARQIFDYLYAHPEQNAHL